jgi:L-cysteine S-thiosulfotransferase
MSKSLIRGAVLAALATSAAVLSANASPLKAPERGYFDVARMAPLTDQQGDPVNGRKIVGSKGLCLSCHEMPIPELADHGNIGPDLHGVGSRLQPPELRMRIVDPKVLNPETPMPSFYKKDLNRVAKKWVGQTILTAQEVEDVVAYLGTLK